MCGYCGFSVPEGEHRCAHCGRRSSGSSGDSGLRYAGATALAAVAGVSAPPIPTTKVQTPQPEIVSRGPAQPALFPYQPISNGVPFEIVRRSESSSLLAAQSAVRSASRREFSADSSHSTQSTIEFLPAALAAPRKLKTSVEAVIYCNEPVAAPLHRMLAGALDASMILLASGLFTIIYSLCGGVIRSDGRSLAMFAGAFGLIALFYGLLWAIWGRETPGMNWTHLRLINFDGFAPDGKSRALRMAGTWLSFCSGTIGLFWALVDEENLTWHDHMSKTFPTLKESNSSFFRQR